MLGTEVSQAYFNLPDNNPYEMNSTSKILIKNALRERLKSNLLFKLPSCCYTGKSETENEANQSCDDKSNEVKIQKEKSIEEEDTNSDNSEENESSNSVPLEERRLRNRLAARKCREKRKQRITNLEKICMDLENRMNLLKAEIEGLGKQKESLTRLLNNHQCVRRAKSL